MSFVEKIDKQISSKTAGPTFSAKQSNLFISDKISKTPIIGVYSVNASRFLYFNNGLERIFGELPNETTDQGWSFLFSRIKPANKKYVRNQISNFFMFPFIENQLCLQYQVIGVSNNEINIKHQILVHKFDQHFLAINYFIDTKKNNHDTPFIGAKAKFEPFVLEKCPPLKISKREKEVLQLIGEGYSSKQIAEMLFISIHTAVSHRKNLIEKFQVKNTAHLVKKAMELVPIF